MSRHHGEGATGTKEVAARRRDIAALIDRAFAEQQKGQSAEAEKLCRRVLAHDPRHFEALHLLGVVAGQTGRPLLGIKLIRQALQARPEAPDALSHLASLVKEEGRLDEAAELYRRAIAAMPGYAAGHNNLGLVHLEKERFAEAAECFARAVRVQPDFANGWFHLGEALEGLDAEAAAAAARERALALAGKSDVPPPWAGIILARQGRFAEAIAVYQKTLDADPRAAGAYYGLVTARKITAVDRPLLARMAGLLADPGLGENGRVQLRFALGKAHDDLAGYREAARHFEEGNRIARARRRRAGTVFDAQQHAAALDRLIATFTPQFFASRAALGADSDLPVLIVGMPRSGTTLVEQILSSHPAVTGRGELRFWDAQARALGLGGIAALDATASRKLAADALALLRDGIPAATRVLDKMPGNFQHLGLFHLVFPRGRIIHCRRDPVDTCLSIFFTLFKTPMVYAHDRDAIVAFYEGYRRLMAHWRKVLPAEAVLDLDYESVASDREGAARRMIAFLGLDWDDACLRHEDNPRPIATASQWQARQPVYQSSVARWRHYEPWLGAFRRLLPPTAPGAR